LKSFHLMTASGEPQAWLAGVGSLARAASGAEDAYAEPSSGLR